MVLENTKRRLLNAFPAFGERNYRLHFLGQFPSTIFTWMQNATLGVFVTDLTHSGFWIGLIAAMTTVPNALFGIFGGAIGDRFDLRRVMYVTQYLSMFLAFVLGKLVLGGHANRYEILVIAFLTGCVNAVDTPSRQAIIRQVVHRENLKSGVSINTAMVHSSLLIGPAIGGILILRINVGWTFIMNGVSFLAVVITLYLMHLAPLKKEREAILKMSWEGIRYSFSNTQVRVIMLLSLAFGMFGYPARTVFPLISKNVLRSDISFTYLVTFIGLGAILGAIITAVSSKRWQPRHFILAGSWAMGVGFIAFSALLIHHFNLALFALFCTGAGFTFGSSILRALVQFITPQFMQSRAMAVLITMFSIGVSGGSFLTGFIADKIGSLGAVTANGVVLVVLGCFLIFKKDQIAEFSPAHSGEQGASLQ